MKNIKLCTLALGMFLSLTMIPLDSMADPNAARTALDVGFRYKLDTSGLETTNADTKAKKTPTKLGVVNEEKNTSTSQEKAVNDLYHRTVSTGLSF